MEFKTASGCKTGLEFKTGSGCKTGVEFKTDFEFKTSSRFKTGLEFKTGRQVFEVKHLNFTVKSMVACGRSQGTPRAY